MLLFRPTIASTAECAAVPVEVILLAVPLAESVIGVAKPTPPITGIKAVVPDTTLVSV